MQPYSVRLLLFVNGGLKSESLCSYEDSPSYCTVLRLLQKDNIALLSLIPLSNIKIILFLPCLIYWDNILITIFFRLNTKN